MKIEVERNLDASEGDCQSCGANFLGRSTTDKAAIKTINIVRIGTTAYMPSLTTNLVCIRLCNECLPKFAEEIKEATKPPGVFWCFRCGGLVDGPESLCPRCAGKIAVRCEYLVSKNGLNITVRLWEAGENNLTTYDIQRGDPKLYRQILPMTHVILTVVKNGWALACVPQVVDE